MGGEIVWIIAPKLKNSKLSSVKIVSNSIYLKMSNKSRLALRFKFLFSTPWWQQYDILLVLTLLGCIYVLNSTLRLIPFSPSLFLFQWMFITFLHLFLIIVNKSTLVLLLSCCFYWSYLEFFSASWTCLKCSKPFCHDTVTREQRGWRTWHDQITATLCTRPAICLWSGFFEDRDQSCHLHNDFVVLIKWQ